MSYLVLIVDDDLTTQALLQEMVKSQGHTPIVCSGGKVAIEMLLALEFQLVILDINLPGVNGWDIFKYIEDNIPRTCVLITTGAKDAKTEAFCKDQHEYYSLCYKPLEKSFIQKVNSLIQKSLTKRKALNNISRDVR